MEMLSSEVPETRFNSPRDGSTSQGAIYWKYCIACHSNAMCCIQESLNFFFLVVPRRAWFIFVALHPSYTLLLKELPYFHIVYLNITFQYINHNNF
jgi:hypothetical protein